MEWPPERQDVKGGERIVVIQGGAKVKVVECIMKHKCSPEELQGTFQSQTIFIRNSNLHAIPQHRSGCLVWLPEENCIAVIIKAIGRRGYAHQVIPPKCDPAFTVDMHQNGFHLEQVCGRKIVEFDQGKRPKKVVNGVVSPLLDQCGKIKCNVAGPDIALVPTTIVPPNINSWMLGDTWSTFRRPRKDDPVPVLYIGQADQTKMREVWVDPATKDPLLSVPLGKPNSNGCSDRCVF